MVASRVVETKAVAARPSIKSKSLRVVATRDMYYSRYKKKILDVALAMEKLTYDQHHRIQLLYAQDLLFLRDSEDVEGLRRILPSLARLDKDRVDLKLDDDVSVYKVYGWPHHKFMCLKFAPTQPCSVIYVQEQNDDAVLFEYRIDTQTVHPKGNRDALVDAPTHATDEEHFEFLLSLLNEREYALVHA